MPLAEPSGAVTATIIAVATGLGAIVTAIGGVLLAIRTVRSRERLAAKKELDQVVEETTYIERLLDWERSRRVDCEAYNHDLLIILRHEGVREPEPPAPGPPRPLRPPHLPVEDEADDGVGEETAAVADDSVPAHRPAPGNVRHLGGGGPVQGSGSG